ncbi:MAG: hypothetical protein ABI051_03735 [Vicinamibacterales bacterium]
MQIICARKRAMGWLVVVGTMFTTGWSLCGVRAESQGRGSAPAPPEQANTEHAVDALSADMTIRQWRIAADGKPLGADPPSFTMKLQRERHGQGWHTSLSLQRAEPPLVQGLSGPRALDNPFLVARFEYDDDGTEPKMYDVSGRVMAGPTEADRARLGLPLDLRDPSWDPTALAGRARGAARGAANRSAANGLLLKQADHSQRRADLQQRFGPRAGQVRGLDRFVHTFGPEVHELLVDPALALTMEMNVSGQGGLLSHAVFEYQPFGKADLLRHHAQAQRVIPASGGSRIVTDVTIANVIVDTRGGR